MINQKPRIPIKKLKKKKKRLTLIPMDRVGFKELATEFKPIRNGRENMVI